ncbi:MAG TPA: chorismate mutase [Pseudonocardiaceae bacterium]
MWTCARDRLRTSFSTGTGLRLPWSPDARTTTRSPGVHVDPGLCQVPDRTPEEPEDHMTAIEPTEPTGAQLPSPPEIGELRAEIDRLDTEILRLIKRRTEVSKMIGATRMASGGTRIVVNREMDVLARYRELGPEGRQLAMVLLNLGRGRLGR